MEVTRETLKLRHMLRRFSPTEMDQGSFAELQTERVY